MLGFLRVKVTGGDFDALRTDRYAARVALRALDAVA